MNLQERGALTQRKQISKEINDQLTSVVQLLVIKSIFELLFLEAKISRIIYQVTGLEEILLFLQAPSQFFSSFSSIIAWTASLPVTVLPPITTTVSSMIVLLLTRYSFCPLKTQ